MAVLNPDLRVTETEPVIRRDPGKKDSGNNGCRLRQQNTKLKRLVVFCGAKNKHNKLCFIWHPGSLLAQVKGQGSIVLFVDAVKISIDD